MATATDTGVTLLDGIKAPPGKRVQVYGDTETLSKTAGQSVTFNINRQEISDADIVGIQIYTPRGSGASANNEAVCGRTQILRRTTEGLLISANLSAALYYRNEIGLLYLPVELRHTSEAQISIKLWQLADGLSADQEVYCNFIVLEDWPSDPRLQD